MNLDVKMEGTNETPLEDQRQQALKHYEQASNAIMHWSSFVRDAILAYNPRKFKPETVATVHLSTKENSAQSSLMITNFLGERVAATPSEQEVQLLFEFQQFMDSHKSSVEIIPPPAPVEDKEGEKKPDFGKMAEEMNRPRFELVPEWSETEYELISTIWKIFKSNPGTDGKKMAVSEMRIKLFEDRLLTEPLQSLDSRCSNAPFDNAIPSSSPEGKMTAIKQTYQSEIKFRDSTIEHLQSQLQSRDAEISRLKDHPTPQTKEELRREFLETFDFQTDGKRHWFALGNVAENVFEWFYTKLTNQSTSP